MSYSPEHLRFLQQFRAVIAIDFGTTNSGVAYGLMSEFEKHQLVPVEPVELDGMAGVKTPTRIVLEKTPPHEPVGFGSEATAMYEDGEHLIFHQFKMQLYSNPMPATVKADVGGGELPVKVVITRCLEYLRDQALDFINNGYDLGLKTEEVRWVLTVPAIWDDQSKTLMTECARAAEFCHTEGSLVLALEPECAALEAHETQSSLLKKGVRYLVVDCGGGTIDTAAFEVTDHEPHLNIKSLQCPDGGNWGGTSVDSKFLDWTRAVFENPPFLARNTLTTFELLCSCWEEKKHMFTANTLSRNRPTAVNMSTVMEKFNPPKRLKDVVARFNLTRANDEKAQHFGAASIRIPAPVMLSFFQEALNNIEDHVKRLVANIGRIDYVLLVGGFGSNTILQQKLREAVESIGSRLIAPQRPSAAIVMGAVRYGFNPRIISERRSPQTYGIRTTETSQDGSFSDLQRVTPAIAEQHRVSKGGRYVLKDYFWKLVEVNEVVKPDIPFTHIFYPSNRSMTSITLPIVATKAKNPVMANERGVREIGRLELQVQQTGTLKDRGVEVSIVFGDTQLIVKGKSISTGQTVETTLDMVLPRIPSAHSSVA